jgi:hypothetical protein
MRNIINSTDQQKIVFGSQFNYHFEVTIAFKIFFSPTKLQTANEYLVKPFARGKAHSFPLQNPIKNVICSPE